MTVQQVGFEEARKLVETQNVPYVDVRSIDEFQAGHAPGAYNVPLMHMAGGAMQPNPNFAHDVSKRFPDKQQPLLVACKAGGRSARAATVLQQLGYTRVYDYSGGWSGNGNDPGWLASGGPSATDAVPGRGYNDDPQG